MYEAIVFDYGGTLGFLTETSLENSANGLRSITIRLLTNSLPIFMLSPVWTQKRIRRATMSNFGQGIGDGLVSLFKVAATIIIGLVLTVIGLIIYICVK
jgi:hypothetical protein